MYEAAPEGDRGLYYREAAGIYQQQALDHDVVLDEVRKKFHPTEVGAQESLQRTQGLHL
jgi:hypothetical protein